MPLSYKPFEHFCVHQFPDFLVLKLSQELTQRDLFPRISPMIRTGFVGQTIVLVRVLAVDTKYAINQINSQINFQMNEWLYLAYI